MVFTTVFAYFSNNIFISPLFTLIFGIWNLYNSPKIIQFFILLSALRAFISNAIYGGERSFKSPSTTSRLILLVLSFLHYHLSTPTRALDASKIARRTGYEPLPSVEGCGLLQSGFGSPSEARM
jgi:hypothetical protein